LVIIRFFGHWDLVNWSFSLFPECRAAGDPVTTTEEANLVADHALEKGIILGSSGPES